MNKLGAILLSLYCVQMLSSCSSNFNTENWVGAVFVSSIDCNGNDFENDSARIELLSDSICKINNLSFVGFADSIKWPEQFVGRWYLYELGDCKYLNISYQHKSTSFNIMPNVMFGDWSPRCVSLHYYIGDPDDMIYHVLIEESRQPFDEIKHRHTLDEVGYVAEGRYDWTIDSGRGGVSL